MFVQLFYFDENKPITDMTQKAKHLFVKHS